MHADFTRVIGLPLLDGILMANAMHYFKDKEAVLRQIHSFLKPIGTFLLVEYNVDSGNPWVPYPLLSKLFAPSRHPPDFLSLRYRHRSSSFLREFYSTGLNSRGKSIGD
jgi:SAM-dependent methyltransferase